MESICSSEPEKTNSESSQRKSKTSGETYGKAFSDCEISQCKLTNDNELNKLSEKITVSSDRPDLVPVSVKEAPRHTENQDCVNLSSKRKVDEMEEESLSKRQRKNFDEKTELPNVPFYYNVSRSKKGVTHK